MGGDKDPADVAFEALDKFIRVIAYLIFASYAFDFIITLPPDIANRIFQMIFQRLGL